MLPVLSLAVDLNVEMQVCRVPAALPVPPTAPMTSPWFTAVPELMIPECFRSASERTRARSHYRG